MPYATIAALLGSCRLRCAAHSASAIALASLLTLLQATSASAGMFDDDEARRQIRDLSIRTNERLDTVAKGQIELANQIQTLREENARLRGQVETLTYELEAAKKRQQDFYIDLDGRLRKFESTAAASPGVSTENRVPPEDSRAAAEPPKKAPSDTAAQTRDYETALNLFRANKLKEAAAAFDSFARTYPDSTLAPNAYYWLGNAHYALRDCRKAMDAHRVVVSKWPSHPKAPDALLNVASCQQELGENKGARGTLEILVAKYPDSAAATTARQRIKK